MPVFQLKSRIEQKPPIAAQKAGEEKKLEGGSSNDNASAIQGNLETSGTETAEAATKNSTIVLDGPLSYLYTKALNVVLAIEDDALIPTDQPGEEKPAMAVYACSGSDLERCNGDYMGQADNIMGTLSKTGAQTQVLAVESAATIGNNGQIMLDYLRSGGVKVVYGISHGSSTLKNMLK